MSIVLLPYIIIESISALAFETNMPVYDWCYEEPR
jgi:hypothetical protein